MKQKSMSDMLKGKGAGGLLTALKKNNLTTSTSANDTGATAGGSDGMQERMPIVTGIGGIGAKRTSEKLITALATPCHHPHHRP